MISTFSDEQKLDMLKKVHNKIICSISTHDIQAESIERYGRLLNDDEIEKAEELLEWGVGENLNFIYDTIFSGVSND